MTREPYFCAVALGGVAVNHDLGEHAGLFQNSGGGTLGCAEPERRIELLTYALRGRSAPALF